MPDWIGFAMRVAARLEIDEQITLTIDEITAATESKNQSLDKRSFWLRAARGELKAFRSCGLWLEPVPNHRGSRVEAVTFRLSAPSGAKESTIRAVVIGRPDGTFAVRTHRPPSSLTEHEAAIVISELVARVVDRLGIDRRFPSVDAALRWVETFASKCLEPRWDEDDWPA